jgi:mannose-6-phosphate isomerase-like protein (cupin superfamily)
MKSVRSILDAPALGEERLGLVAALESVTVVTEALARNGVTPLRCGAGDEVLVVLEGSAVVATTAGELDAPAGTVVSLPPGSAYRVVNVGAGELRTVSLLVPGIRPGQPLYTSVAAGPAGSAGAGGSTGAAPFATRIETEGFAAGGRPNGFAVQPLVSATDGVTSVLVNAARVEAGGAGPKVHIQTFDQLFVVLTGTLSVDIAGQTVTAPTHSVVILPTGVPHTQWNDGPGEEVHLAVLVPPPGPGEPITVPVAFSRLP